MQDLLQTAADVSTIEDLKEWTRKSIRPLFPHETLACCYGHMNSGGVSLDYVIAIDYPLEHFKAIRNSAGGIETPILRRWLTTREPQLFELEAPWSDVPTHWLQHIKQHDLRNVAAHAVLCQQRCIGTYYTFHRIPGRLGESHQEMLQYLAPIMHDVLYRVISNVITNTPKQDTSFAKALEKLSPRERDVLHWMQRGKHNPEISLLTGISESTIKHHLTHIFYKLGVFTRTQLISQLAAYEAQASPSGTKIL